MDEMTQLNLMGSAIPLPTEAELRGEERRLLAEIAAPGSERLPGSGVLERLMRPIGGGRPRPVLVAGVATGLAAASVAGIALTGVHSRGPGSSSYLPQAVPVAVVQTLDHAADTASRQRELHPKPGQFLVFTSQGLESVETNLKGRHWQHLKSFKRIAWLPAMGRSTGGVVSEELLPPKRFGGQPLPPDASRGVGEGPSLTRIDFDKSAEYLRTDYAYLSRLPTDRDGMRAHLYTRLKPGTDYGDTEAWSRVGSMLTDAYMPPAQRATLFRAAATIPGAESRAGPRTPPAVRASRSRGWTRRWASGSSTSSMPRRTRSWASGTSW